MQKHCKSEIKIYICYINIFRLYTIYYLYHINLLILILNKFLHEYNFIRKRKNNEQSNLDHIEINRHLMSLLRDKIVNQFTLNYTGL